MVLNEQDLSTTVLTSEKEQEVRKMLFEFVDTLIKIKQFANVISIHFVDLVTDIYVVTEEEDVDLTDKIITKFAQWEASYHIFPELHIITKDELFYIQNGAIEI